MIRLLAGAIDYAGLFPPAALPMAEAMANYRRYRASPDAWALGRFVVPAAQLEAVLAEGWPLAVTLPAGQTPPLPDSVDAIEAPTRSETEIAALVAAYPRAQVFCELDPASPDLDALASAAKRLGARAKLRTGGLTADKIPAPELVLRFLDVCKRHELPFKATAGLHHPLRGRYPLTYAPDAPTAVMHGFTNLAAAVENPDDLLCEDFYQTSRLVAAGARARRLFVGFGSCSFVEPLDELAMLPKYEDGVDMTLIRSFLALTPAARIAEVDDRNVDLARIQVVYHGR